VSVNAAGNAAGGGASSARAITPDGRFVLFGSLANDLTPLDTGGADVFVRDLLKQTTTLVSVNFAGTANASGTSSPTAITPTGRLVLFGSNAKDLVSTDYHISSSDVFVRDLRSATTTLVSLNGVGFPSGTPFATSIPFGMTPGGKVVLFQSTGEDLAFNDFNGQPDVFVSDLHKGSQTCRRWCECTFPPGPDRDKCSSDGKKGRGLCFTPCGLAAVYASLCGGPDYDSIVCCVVDPSRCTFEDQSGCGVCNQDAIDPIGRCALVPFDCAQNSNCSGNGVCDRNSGVCVCDSDWTGSDCATFTGPPLSCTTDGDCPRNLFCVSGACSPTIDRGSGPVRGCQPTPSFTDFCFGNGLCSADACQCATNISGTRCENLPPPIVSICK
jgi:hypothetical protein